MRCPCLVCCLAALVLVLGQRLAPAQQEEGTRAGTLRRELVSTRRVGYLRFDRKSNEFSILDNWDRQAYQVTAAEGLDLEPYVDRYVALRGESVSGKEPEVRGFVAERVTALDDRKQAGSRDSNVRPAALHEKIVGSQNKTPAKSASQLTQQLPPQRIQPIPVPLPNPNPPAFQEVTPVLPPITVDGPDPSALDVSITGGGLQDFEGEGEVRPSTYWWARGEYLMWSMDSLRLPALVTTSPVGTPQADAGVLGEPNTSVLFGGEVNGDLQSGVRALLGVWLDNDRVFGVEADSIWFQDETTSFSDRSLGDRILARPFFDAANGVDTAALIAFPALVRGDISAIASSNFYSGGLRARLNYGGDIDRAFAERGIRLDWLLGYRYMQLKDSVTINENLVSLDPLNQGLFNISDSFSTRNEFQGIDVGIVQQRTRGPFSVEWLVKVALGINRQSVSIDGSSIIDEAGLVGQFPGGILALPSNMGTYTRNEFAIVPELGGTIGWHVNERFTVTVGYSLIYFSNVVRAGDQISLDLNSNQFPPPVAPLTGPLRPAFAFQESDFWAQGLSVGADFRW